MDERVGLWWGTVEGAAFDELVDAAAAAGFTDISVTPAMYFAARADGRTDGELRSVLDRRGVAVAVIDPLIRGLPGSPAPEAVGRRFRSTFEHDEADCYRAAEALAARAVNVAHFLGAATPVDALADAIGAVAGRAAARGLEVLVEFMPEGSIGDLETAAAIVAAVGAPNCGIMFDSWHHWRGGGDTDQVRALPRGTVRTVQLSDALDDVRGSGTQPPTSDRLLPGEGAMALTTLVEALRENNPRALFGLEVFSAERRALDPRERARRARAALDANLAGPWGSA